MLQPQLRLARAILLALIVPLLFVWHGPALAAPSQLKVLAIGNSFSQDGMQHLFQIAQNAGIENIVIGNMYIGGASLETHWNNARAKAPAYRYDKNVSGVWQSRANTTLQHGIQDEQWDVITLQQASGFSGVPASFTAQDRLQNLINYVNEHKTNPDAKLAWHFTWAYQSDSTHNAFATYGRNQMTMFTAIVNAVRQQVVPNEAFDLIIPTGAAIQNVRTSYIGDTLTRDGYHLSLNLGRYIGGLTWLHALGWPIDDITWVPSTAEVPAEYLPIVKEAVKAAVDHPFAVSISSYVDRPTSAEAPIQTSSIPAGYKLFDWEPVVCAYWNSRDAGGNTHGLISRENSTAGNLCYFISPGRLLTREDLPVGTIIELDPGFQYRPEGWVTLGRQASRPGPVATERVVVTEEWWGNYNYRAFNVSFAGSTTDVRGREDEVISAFRIYVPE